MPVGQLDILEIHILTRQDFQLGNLTCWTTILWKFKLSPKRPAAYLLSFLFLDASENGCQGRCRSCLALRAIRSSVSPGLRRAVTSVRASPEESWDEALHQDNPEMFGTERVCAGRWRCPPCGKEVDYGHLCSGKHLNKVYSCWVAIYKTEPAPVNVNLLTLPTDPEKPKPTPLAIEDEDVEGEAEPQAPGPLRRPPAASQAPPRRMPAPPAIAPPPELIFAWCQWDRCATIAEPVAAVAAPPTPPLAPPRRTPAPPATAEPVSAVAAPPAAPGAAPPTPPVVVAPGPRAASPTPPAAPGPRAAPPTPPAASPGGLSGGLSAARDEPMATAAPSSASAGFKRSAEVSFRGSAESHETTPPPKEPPRRRRRRRSPPSVPPLSFGRDGGVAVMGTTGGVWAQPEEEAPPQEAPQEAAQEAAQEAPQKDRDMVLHHKPTSRRGFCSPSPDRLRSGLLSPPPSRAPDRARDGSRIRIPPQPWIPPQPKATLHPEPPPSSPPAHLKRRRAT